MKKRVVKKWIGGILGTTVLIVLLLQATLLFFGEKIFKESILLGFRQYSESAFPPDKQPTLDFDKLSINIFTGNLSVTGLYFSGYVFDDTTQSGQADHLQLAVPRAEILAFKILDLYKYRKLQIKEIIFFQPEVKWLSAAHANTSKLVPNKTIHTLANNLQRHVNEYLHSFSVESFTIKDGNIFVARQNTPSIGQAAVRPTNKLHAQHVSIKLTDFLLDSLSERREDRIFFTKDIDIQLGDYQLLLSDSTYLLKADTLGFSTRQKKIYLKELQVLPVSSEAADGVRVNIPEVSLTAIDWRDLYFDSLLVAHQLILTKPSFTANIGEDSLNRKKFFRLDKLHPDSIYQQIRGPFKKLQINEVVVNQGEFQIHKHDNDTLQLLKIEEANAILADFLLDGLVDKDSLKNVLPVNTVAFEAKKIKLYLPDQKHYFTAVEASLKTERERNFACDVRFNGALFKAGVDSLEDLLLAPPSKPLAFDVSIPSVSFYGIQLGALARERAAVLDSIYIQKPQVTIANFSPQSVGKQAAGLSQQVDAEEQNSESVKSLLYDWSNAQLNLSPIIAPGDSSALFQWLEAGEVQIDSGTFHILKANDDLSGFTTITSVDTFYAYLNNISIDRLENDIDSEVENFKVAVLATDVDVFLQNSEFLLPGEKGGGGLLSVEDARVSTLNQEAYMRNLYFWTNTKKPPSSEVWLHEMYIPYVQFTKVDIKKIYLQQEAEVAHLGVYSPQITLNYKENNKLQKDFDFDYENIYPQLAPYLDKISVPSVNIKNAKFLLQRINRYRVEPLFSTQKLDVQLKGFYLDSLSRMSRNRPFYANLLAVQAENYQWNFYPEDDTYPLLGVKGKRIHYHSQEGELELSQLNMLTNISNRPDLVKMDIYCDKIIAKEIDPFQLIHDKRLQVDRLSIQKPLYQMEERTGSDEVQQEAVLVRQSLQPDLNKLLNKNLQSIHLREVQLEEGKLSYLQKRAKDTLAYVSVNAVTFKANDIRANQQKSRHLHHILYADEIEFGFFADHLLFNPGADKHAVAIQDVHFSSANSHLSVGKLQIVPPKNVFSYADKTHFDFRASDINLSGLDFKKAYLYGNFNVNQLNIEDTDLKVYLRNQRNDQQVETVSIYEVISPYLENLNVSKLAYPQSSVAIYQKKSKQAVFISDKVSAEIKDFHLDQPSLDKGFITEAKTGTSISESMFFSDDINITIRDYGRSLDNGLYSLSADAIKVGLSAQKIGISGLRLQPQLSRKEVLQKYTFSKSLANLYVDQITLAEVDFKALLENEKLIVGQMTIDEPVFEVFEDKRLPKDPNKRPGLHQELLFDLDYLIDIRQLRVTDGMIAYAERAAGAEKEGVITFEEVNATATHLTNDPMAIRDSLVTTLEVNTKVMGEGMLKTAFRFPLAEKDLKFYVTGTLGRMDLTKFNQMLEPVAFMHIKEGINQEMRFNFSGDRNSSSGTMEFRYNNLSVQIKDKEKGNSGLDEKLGTFIANAFILKANNPKAVFLRIGHIDYERDKSKAMFHYWWQSLLSGVKSSIGLEKNMEKTKDFAELENE